MKVAILDWGVGGLGFYKFFKAAYPDFPIIYWSDAGWRPYGLVAGPELRRRIRFIAGRLGQRNVSHLVIACNAASSAFKQGETGPFTLACGSSTLQATGVIAPTIRCCLELDVGKIGIIGGRRTILSQTYRRDLVAAGYQVRQRVAQPLSARIERGDIDSPQLHQELSGILAPLRGVHALVMGCTHYPAAEGAIKRQLPGVQLIDPAWETMKDFERWWRPTLMGGEDEFVTTGDPEEMIRSAATAFQLELSCVRKECGD